ncbi:hypothetical protein QTP86_018690 [Hemibagrus guttatus]|nr:hypothetical protein QTP86_018690 [Hemibagrus guttatus]
MSGGERLFRCEDPAVWKGIYAKYWAVVEAKAAGKQKSSGKLLELEKWYQEQLPAAILAHTERSLTQPELVKLMEWKLTSMYAVLAAGAPREVAFMADEVVESIAELRPVQYTAKHFSLFLEKILHKTHQLNKADSQQDWTPHKVELCLWAWEIASQIQPSLLEGFSMSDSTNRETKEEETRAQPSKRRKTE